MLVFTVIVHYLVVNSDGPFVLCLACHNFNISRQRDSYRGHEEQYVTEKVSDPRKLNLGSVDENDRIKKASSPCKLNSISIELLDKEG